MSHRPHRGSESAFAGISSFPEVRTTFETMLGKFSSTDSKYCFIRSSMVVFFELVDACVAPESRS